ncbi:glycosyltransferase family 76 protein [Schizopora paradoxa]|uniref:GPI mannosyltransferase 2 n=1 Tax=Schizopora paradoxa TaxID=27342 RepID=A0A0H2S343_9AGAM|nr:glycosyltransferase family 76 protein [Schizopora paradoxa]
MTSSQHKWSLVKAVVLARAIGWTILILSSLLPAFDSSAALVLDRPFFSFLLRWDAFHFVHIAKEGYAYEHEFAFFPGTPSLMRFVSGLMAFFGLTSDNGFENLLVGGAIAGLASDTAIIVLYDLTNLIFESPSFAYLCSLLFLLSSSPATLRNAPYAEPFFAYFSFQGMLFCAKKRWILASMFFSAASIFRSNGVMLCIYLAWGILVQPIVSKPGPARISHIPVRTFVYCAALCTLPLLSLGYYQYYAYQSFCLPSPSRPWCSRTPPLVYTFVQAEYWNSGLFKYWTISQIPNFLLAAPVLILLFASSIYHAKNSLVLQFRLLLVGQPPLTRNTEPILQPAVAPYAIHAFVLSVTLLTSAHVQIALRLASSLPFTYWAAGNLWVRASRSEASDRNYGRWWTTWSIVWSLISLVLWSTFLPPA